jgi:exopolysaccharide biosynthesis polyprenyl glycosylphosphotransferase
VAVVGFGFHLALPRSLVALVIPGAVVLAVAFRLMTRQMLQRLRAGGRCQHGVVVVGRPDSALPLVVRLQEMPERAFRIAQVCAAESVTIDEVLQAVRDGNADTVAIAADSGLSSEQLRRLGWELEGSRVDLMVSTDLVEVAGPRIHVRPMAGMPLLHVEQPEFTGINRFVKGTYDRGFALLALVVLAPFLVLVALAVRVTSKGPAVFRQVRVGRYGERFTVLKFRTMRQGAHEELESLADLNEADGPLFKMRNDPRVTRLGKVMRRYSIDELPQLVNVATGRMSLVGPRPPLPAEVEQYGSDAGRRLLVKPGLTGLWQVSGRSDLGWDQSVRLDLHYVENWSPALDLLILIKTAKAVLQRDGAY